MSDKKSCESCGFAHDLYEEFAARDYPTDGFDIECGCGAVIVVEVEVVPEFYATMKVEKADGPEASP